MESEKYISRKDFLKYLFTVFFAFMCFFYNKNVIFSKDNDVLFDSNNIKY